MKMIKNIFFLIGIMLFANACKDNVESKVESEKIERPNIVYILADDLGYGDLSSYGQVNFHTPNIDRLAARGMKFTQHYSGATVCAPSRSSLMTGLHTGHTPIRGNKELPEEGQTALPANSVTIAEIAKKAGYTTGAFGKWGLGFIGTEGDPNNQGFDEFYGYNCQRMAHRYYPPYLWHNDQKVVMEGNDWTNTVTYSPDKIQEATLQFLEDNKDHSFFAFVPLVQPHAELIVPHDSILEKYVGKFPETPFTLDPDNYASDYGKDIEPAKYTSQKIPHAVFAAMIDRLDVYVGQIVSKLEELGVADNTIIMFASDNGPHIEGGADPAFFNSSGGLRGVKRDLYEGGIRSPFIVVWPNKIKAGSVSNHVSSFWDMKPTLADLLEVELDSETDGISMLPELMGTGDQKKHEFLYWEFGHKGGRVAVRMGDWKGVAYDLEHHPDYKIELYNLANDVAETNDVAGANPEIVAQIKQIMRTERTESELFPLITK